MNHVYKYKVTSGKKPPPLSFCNFEYSRIKRVERWVEDVIVPAGFLRGSNANGASNLAVGLNVPIALPPGDDSLGALWMSSSRPHGRADGGGTPFARALSFYETL